MVLSSHYHPSSTPSITLEFDDKTGDTGPAAVHAVREAANPLLTILVHYPHGQISEFQRKQLTTVYSKYVKVASFEGSGDDMDYPIKQVLLMNGYDDVNTGGRKFCGINSYNIGRPLLQMVHFVSVCTNRTCFIHSTDCRTKISHNEFLHRFGFILEQ